MAVPIMNAPEQIIDILLKTKAVPIQRGPFQL